MGVGTLIRSAIPSHLRSSLRRSGIANRLLAMWYGGLRSAPHPQAPYQLYFDGYRNLGWSTGSLQALEADEFEFARRILQRRKCDCVWDIGANVGLWTLFLAGIEPKIPRIICFEPDVVNLRYLRMNLEKNAIDRAMIRDVALSSAPGTGTFFADTVTGSTGGLETGPGFTEVYFGHRRTAVETVISTIDDEIAGGQPPPQFVKIDVEGHEADLLEGGRRMLAAHRPAILIEVSQNHDRVRQIFDSLGYRMRRPSDGSLLETPEFATACVHMDDDVP